MQPTRTTKHHHHHVADGTIYNDYYYWDVCYYADPPCYADHAEPATDRRHLNWRRLLRRRSLRRV